MAYTRRLQMELVSEEPDEDNEMDELEEGLQIDEALENNSCATVALQTPASETTYSIAATPRLETSRADMATVPTATAVQLDTF